MAARTAPELGLAFLGAQGDIWDAQKDMLLGGTGAIVAMLIVFLWRVHQQKVLVVNGD